MCQKVNHTHLLPSNRHVILNIPEDSRLDEVTAVSRRPAATHEFGALTLPTADVAKDLLELFLVDLSWREEILMNAISQNYVDWVIQKCYIYVL